MKKLLFLSAAFLIAQAGLKAQTGNGCSSAETISLSTTSSTCDNDDQIAQNKTNFWYKFTAIRSVTNFIVNYDPQTASISGAHIYTGSCNSLTEVGAIIDTHTDSIKIFLDFLVGGQTYYIRLDKSSGNSVASFTICSSPASQLPWQVTGSNTQFDGNIGVGTSPTVPLDVLGAAHISGALTTGSLTSGAATVSSLSSGNVSSSGNLNVAGTTTLTGAVTTGALTSGATTASSFTSTSNIKTATLNVTGSSLFGGSITNPNLAGSGFTILHTDANGLFNMLPSGTASQILYGNGTWGNLPPQQSILWNTVPGGNNIFYNMGTVGIGTSTPNSAYALDVNGDANVSGNLYVGGGIVIAPVQTGTILPTPVPVPAGKLMIHAAELQTSKINADTISMDSLARITGIATFSGLLRARGALDVTGDASFTGNLDAQTITFSGQPAITFSTALGQSANQSVNQNQLKLMANTSVGGTLQVNSLAGGTGLSEVYVDANGNLSKAIDPGTNPGTGLPPCSIGLPPWRIGGNTIGTYTNAVLGTCDLNDLVFEANSHNYMWLKPNGNFGIGNSAPYKMLTVNGDVSLANYPSTGHGNLDGLSAIEILGQDQVPTRRGIAVDFNPNGDFNFFINTQQTTGTTEFNFKNGTDPSQTNYATGAASPNLMTISDAGAVTIFGNNNNFSPLTVKNTLTNKNLLEVKPDGSTLISGNVGIGGAPAVAALEVKSNSATGLGFAVFNFTSPNFSIFSVAPNGSTNIVDGASDNNPLLTITHSNGSSLSLLGNGTGDIISSSAITPYFANGHDFSIFEGDQSSSSLRLKVEAGGAVTIPAIKNTTTSLYSSVLVDATGKLVTGSPVSSTSSAEWVLGGNAGGQGLGTNDGSDLSIITGTGTEKMRIGTDGSTTINTSANNALIIKDASSSGAINFKVRTNGQVYAREVIVSLTAFPFPDYVFTNGYKLMPLGEVKKFTETYHHLPNMPTAKEVETNGANLGEIQRVSVEKIEEVYLYLIEINKKLEKVEKENADLKEELKKIKSN